MSRKSPLAQALAAHPNVTRITAPGDPRAEAWRKLGETQTARTEQERFQVEGLRPAELLLADGVYPVDELIVVAEELLHRQKETQARAAALIRQAAGKKIPVFDVTRELFRKLAGVNKIRGVMAIAELVPQSVEELVEVLAQEKTLGIAAVGLNDPGNVGTLMRSGYAFGARALFALEGATEPFHPKVLRASAGHLLRACAGTWPAFRAACTKHQVRVIGLDAGAAGAQPLHELTPQPDTATVICVGSEGHGFPPGVQDFDLRVSIPMRGGAESLNAGVAGALLLWQVRSR